MIIQNFDEIANRQDKKLALSIIGRGLDASLPGKFLDRVIRSDHLLVGRKRIVLKGYSGVYVVAVGKSADLMTRVVMSTTSVNGGIVVVPCGTKPSSSSKKIEVLFSSHPVPNGKSVIAAKRICKFLKSLGRTDFVIFLISGGASSLISMPEGISLREKQAVTRQLLRSGANIREINCVRKHLSKIKGGRLLELLPCNAVSLVMSDVIGDDLSVIASGTTYCDRSTFSDAKNILKKYNLNTHAPKSVLRRIGMGEQGLIPETPKKPKIDNFVIASNRKCLEEMAVYSRKLGFKTRILWSVGGKSEVAAKKIIANFDGRKSTCLIFGGETTVVVKGDGIGGRNQELAMNLIGELKGRNKKIVVACVGTDGKDGNSKAAGALATSDMPSEDMDRYLRKNNSNRFFKKYGGEILTGHTHTNLMDIGIVLRK
ncbi:MAG: DUF4147 domain-containing protein [Thaumarchaeota archaeon]|nr:DUF4147 domain-containing protein [Nitrososphaerota archaeon]